MKTPSNSFISGFITASVAIFCIFSFSFFRSADASFPGGSFAASRAISWNDAITMRNKFKSLQPLKIEISGNNGIAQVPLEGFTIQSSQLLEIIQNNKNGGMADAVMFYLGAEDPQVGYSLPQYHIIAVGLNSNGLMIPNNERDRNDASKSSVFDKADPCPPFCPTE